MKPTVKFVPNDESEPVDELIQREAARIGQDLETVVVVPFSELEGSVLHEIDSTILVEGHPVPMQLFGNPEIIRVDLEQKPTKLGEELTDELEALEDKDPVIELWRQGKYIAAAVLHSKQEKSPLPKLDIHEKQ